MAVKYPCRASQHACVGCVLSRLPFSSYAATGSAGGSSWCAQPVTRSRTSYFFNQHASGKCPHHVWTSSACVCEDVLCVGVYGCVWLCVWSRGLFIEVCMGLFSLYIFISN